jgi:hypothetical protein
VTWNEEWSTRRERALTEAVPTIKSTKIAKIEKLKVSKMVVVFS